MRYVLIKAFSFMYALENSNLADFFTPPVELK